VWDAATGREEHTLRGHAGPALAVAFLRDGTRLASGGFDGTARVWDPATGRAVASVELVPGGALAGGGTVVGAGDGDTVAILTVAGLHLIDPASNQVRARIPLRHGGAVAAGAGAVWVTDEVGGRLLRVELEP
jgi:WD40 repeat protein